jgi:hypothetical protein
MARSQDLGEEEDEEVDARFSRYHGDLEGHQPSRLALPTFIGRQSQMNMKARVQTNLKSFQCKERGVFKVTVATAKTGWQKLADKYGDVEMKRRWDSETAT